MIGERTSPWVGLLSLALVLGCSPSSTGSADPANAGTPGALVAAAAGAGGDTADAFIELEDSATDSTVKANGVPSTDAAEPRAEDAGNSSASTDDTQTNPKSQAASDPDVGTADQPYANVTAVAASGSAGSYLLDVSVESADIDCSQFADWWEVLGEDGTLIYRRVLQHSHTDENGTSDPDAPGNTFTRGSEEPVPIAADTVVIVRAHMSNGGYNGQVMRGSVAAGFLVAEDVPTDFAAAVETEPPQPDTCMF